MAASDTPPFGSGARAAALKLALALFASALLALATHAGDAGPAAPAWAASALKLVPQGLVAGQAIRTDEAALTGVMAVFPAGADDPEKPASAYAPSEVLVVTLRRNGGALESVSARLRPREASDMGETQGTASRELMDEFAEQDRKVAATAKSLPPGTMPCRMEAWSADTDPNGLNVRAEPSVKARILGRLPPPYKPKIKGSEMTPEGGWLTEFHVIGYRSGWFLIEGAKPPGKDYEDESDYPKSAPRPYAGRGWVHSSKVGANFANGATRGGGLFQAPHVDAAWTPVNDSYGYGIGADNGPDRIFACSGLWALVEINGKRGWWRSLCSNQVTNCS